MSETKAQKIAAARKKLKEYQKRGGTDITSTTTTPGVNQLFNEVDVEQQPNQHTSTASSVTSTLSERSESETNLNGSCNSGAARTIPDEDDGSGGAMSTLPTEVDATITSATTTTLDALSIGAASSITSPMPSVASYFSAPVPSTPAAALETYFTSTTPTPPTAQSVVQTTSTPPIVKDEYPEEMSQKNLNAIQVLITEKSQLTNDVNKYRHLCREKDLELEELRTQFINTSNRLEEVQQHFMTQQLNYEELRNTTKVLQDKLAQAEAHSDTQQSHMDELKKQLEVVERKSNELERQLQDKCNELDMAKLRINQLSDESNVGKDDRIETLTQKQFMYEQQVRDLQAMVHQLTYDKEQANTQYQNYTQNLNGEITKLNEKNCELMDECAKLQERERQFVDHISTLERDIQKNMKRQDQYKDDTSEKEALTNAATASAEQIRKLEEKLGDYEFERHEFQLKIKSQEDHLENLRNELQRKTNDLIEIQERFEQIAAEQPDKSKLFAAMESDKVAASRALIQNVELKKQLDELELRFVQLTNDKAELMNRLDAEEYANREMRSNYERMEERSKESDERFKFKDEEMIRLSRENMELQRINVVLQQQMQDYEAKEYNEHFDGKEKSHDIHENHSDHVGDDDNHDDHHHHHHNKHDHHNHDHHKTEHSESDTCQEAKETRDGGNEPISIDQDVETTNDRNKNIIPDHHYQHQHHIHNDHSHQHHHHLHNLASDEAVEKLKHRFTSLMTQVADLTDEKQRLEHLVQQLQCETETIGEYITLYQQQRRILKQREYEKTAQMKLLKAEREQLREKIIALNKLVSSLGAELPPQHNMLYDSNATTALADSISIEPPTLPSSSASQKSDNSELCSNVSISGDHAQEIAINEKLNSNESKEILTKIQNIITEIRENTRGEVPTVPMNNTVDHLNCCSGKFEIV